MSAARSTQTIRSVTLAVALAILVVDVVYLFGVKFPNAFHSDAATTVLVAAEAMKHKTLIAPNWYWANGDVWVLGPQLYAMPVAALFGVGVEQLRGVVVFGFLLQVAVLACAFKHLVGNWQAALLGAAASLLAWSRIHVLFVYIELAYGFNATAYVALFTVFAALLARLDRGGISRTRLRLIAAGAIGYEMVLGLQNPTRSFVFGFVPLLVAVLWPYRKLALRTRATMLVAAVTGWVWSKIVYTFVIGPRVTVSIPSGHLDFVVKDASGIFSNVTMIGRGLFELAGGADSWLLAVPCLFFMIAALVRVAIEIFASRDYVPVRFVCIAACANFGTVLVPLAIGNLMVTPPSVRYLMPGFLGILGLAIILVWRDLQGEGLRRRAAVVLAPVFAVAALLSLFSVVGTYSLENPTSGQWARRAAHPKLAAELTRRDLRHGFGNYWNAALVSLLASGATRTCGVHFGRTLVPYRWNTEVECFEREQLPDRYYVVIRDDEQKQAAEMQRQWTVPPLDRFRVDEFEVVVFPTTPATTKWLAKAIPEGERIHFPLTVPITHPHWGYGEVREEDDSVVLTGKSGLAVYGPGGLTLPAGRFRVTWIGSGVEGSSEGELIVDVASERGAKVYSSIRVSARAFANVRNGKLFELDFTIPKRTAWLELRIFTEGGAKARLEASRIDRLD